MKDKFVEFIKGIIIGIANIMPGFSGGIMAVSFNIYDKIIWSFSNILSRPFKVIKEVWHIVAGVIIGILIAILGISALLEKAPVATILFFTGLIVGSIPSIFEKVKSKKFSIFQIIAFLIGIFIIVGIPLIIGNGNNVVVEKVDFSLLITLFLLGIVASLTMIIPGVSGTLILLAFGYYQYIVNLIKDFIKALLKFDFNYVFNNILLIAALGLGIVFGLISLSKLMEKLMAKFPKIMYAGIFGLLVASPFAIIYQMIGSYDVKIEGSMIATWIIGVIFLGIGVFAADYASRYEQKYKIKKDKE